MDELLNQIKDYINFLEKTFGLDVSVCDTNERLFCPLMKIAPLNSHKNFYCTFLKKNPRIQKECIAKQYTIRSRLNATDCFEGMCYAGMYEYVYKISHDNEYLGFISISSLEDNRQKSLKRMRAICEKYGFKYGELLKIYDNTVKKTDKSIDYYKPVIKPLCSLIELLYIKINNPVENEKSDDYIFNRILSYIIENYNTDIKIEDIASALHYSKYYISHIFTQKRNMPIVFHINDLRVQKAKELLVKTNFSITEIAYQVGFNDSNYFTSIFKKYAKITPMKYRKAHKTK